MSIFKKKCFFLLDLFEEDIKQYLQVNWTVCTFIRITRMPDTQEAKCFEFKVQMSPPRVSQGGGANKIYGASRNFRPLDLFLYTPLVFVCLCFVTPGYFKQKFSGVLWFIFFYISILSTRDLNSLRCRVSLMLLGNVFQVSTTRLLKNLFLVSNLDLFG